MKKKSGSEGLPEAVLVTGTAGGIGLGCARRFAADGLAVAMVDIDHTRGEAAAKEIRDSGGNVEFFECDVGEKEQVDRTVAAAVGRFGAIGALVANAGINRQAEFVDLSEDDFDAVIRTNLKSVFLCGQAVARHMIEQEIKGAIVNMSSTHTALTMPRLTAYAASKGGVSAMTNAMALSLAPHGIRVNAIGPGTILTELTRSRLWEDEGQRRMILSRTPLGRFGEPEDVAGLAAFLISRDASYLTGQTIYLDGGRMGLNHVMPVAD